MMIAGGGSLGDLLEVVRSAEQTAVGNVQASSILVAAGTVLTQQAFVLTGLYGLSSDQIAKIMSVKPGTVRTLMARARQKLRRHVKATSTTVVTPAAEAS
ncbi:RNA polymerase sigma factor [Streptomyces sp. NPDC086783]|uniref:RNA polymerase sigma factor n=1 Tax=Streptomyces sp. NPDC086783 TaxID=3365758 RepID=UPI00382036DE